VLTRLEIDGFKNLLNFSIDFGPFTCIAGPNGVGKSNIFDAIRFLSLLTENTLTEAALKVRGSDVRELFRSSESEQRDEFRIAAEMIVAPEVRDDFGRPADASSTFLRYEIGVGYEAPSHPGALGRLVLLHESLNYVTQGDATAHLKIRHTPKFRNGVVLNKRRTAGYISTTVEDGQTKILVHQDGGSRGPAQVAPAATAPRTIVGTSNTSATPTILAARREMQRWQFLALEPSAMRQPDRFQTDSHVTSSGGHLPATVHRLALDSSKSGSDPDRTYSEIVARINQLVPIRDLRIDVDEVRQILTLQVCEATGVWLPAASLSDGTLRFLALAILVADPLALGLICIEEPENGIHPAKMEEMVNLLRDLAVDSEISPDRDNPFRQVIVATHSPAFVQLVHSQDKDDLLFAEETMVRGASGKPERTVRCRPLRDTWRTNDEDRGVGLATIMAYLVSPAGAQLPLGLTA
jgi:predicted ATPase